MQLPGKKTQTTFNKMLKILSEKEPLMQTAWSMNFKK